MSIPKLLITGFISSGKSSFTNALLGFQGATTTKMAETGHAITYILSPKGTEENGVLIAEQLKYMKKINKTMLNDLHNGNDSEIIKRLEEQLNNGFRVFEKCPVKSDLNVSITDFPGFGDINDKHNLIMNTYSKIYQKYDMILYVCDANAPFITTAQVHNIRKIIDLIYDSNRKNLTNIELVIIVAKYDDCCDNSNKNIISKSEDRELRQMYENITSQILKGVTEKKDIDKYTISKNKIYRVNNYQMFVKRCLNKFYVSEESEQEMKNIKTSLFGKSSVLTFSGLCIRPSVFTELKGSGDWDNIIGRLKELTVNIDEHRAKNIISNVINTINDGFFINDITNNDNVDKANKKLTNYCIQHKFERYDNFDEWS